MIYQMSVSPLSKIPGWCYMSRPHMASEFGVSKQSILNLIDSLIDKGFMIKDLKTSYLKTTHKWNLNYFTEGKESLPLTGKESLPHGGKESLPNNNTIDNKSLFDNKDDCDSTLNTKKKEEGFVAIFNGATGHKIRVLDSKAKRQFYARIKEGYHSNDFEKAIRTAFKDMTERGTVKHLMPEFITRPAEFSKYLNMKEETYKVTINQIDHR